MKRGQRSDAAPWLSVCAVSAGVAGPFQARRVRGAAGGHAAPLPGCCPRCLRSSPRVGHGSLPPGSAGSGWSGWSGWSGSGPGWYAPRLRRDLLLPGCFCFALRAAYGSFASLQADSDVWEVCGAARSARGLAGGALPGVHPQSMALRRPFLDAPSGSRPGYPWFALRAAYRRFAALQAGFHVLERSGAVRPAQAGGECVSPGLSPAGCAAPVSPGYLPGRLPGWRCFFPRGAHRRPAPVPVGFGMSGPRGGRLSGPPPGRFCAFFCPLYIKGKKFCSLYINARAWRERERERERERRSPIYRGDYFFCGMPGTPVGRGGG